MIFKKNCTSNVIIVSLIESIQKSVDDKQITCGVFIDAEKTFDTVDHTYCWINYLIKVLEIFQIGSSNINCT